MDKKPVGHGGRRPGAGRKPIAKRGKKAAKEKDVYFNARVSAQTLDALKAEAEASTKGSVSALVGYFIKRGLEAKRDAARSDATRALCYLIAELSDAVCNIGSETIPWRYDPFMFETFRLSIDKLMRILAPRGEIVAPDDKRTPLQKALFGRMDSPDDRANIKVLMTVRALVGSTPQPLTIPEGYTTEMAKLAQGYAYGIFQAKCDLGYENFSINDLSNLNEETNR